jgi:REP element-mobilizing transposase RayT
MVNALANKTVESRGWRSRGYLPHFDGGEICQFITLRLGDALPQKVTERWKTELAREKDEIARAVIYRRAEKYLDCGYGECLLRKEFIAEQAQESLLHFDSIRYKLIAWVVMPNHAHFLIKPVNDFTLKEIMQKYKSFTAHECNKLLNRGGRFWQEDYFDRFVRNYEHFEATVNYIENNPVKARLCEKPSDWKFSSAHFRNK